MLKWLKKGVESVIPNRSKETDISSEIAQGKHFKKRLLNCAEEAASCLIKGESLSEAVARISKRESFNRLQMQRLVEETNTIAFNKKYDMVRSSNDRRVSFDLADLDTSLDLMGESAPPAIENPNWMKGKPGEGEISKMASVHTPNTQVEAMRERMLAKQASKEQERLVKQSKDLSREIESGLFKIANSLVTSHRHHGNGNVLFNTLLEKVAFDEVMIDGITKKAEEITSYLKEHKKVADRFDLVLSVAPHEKIASTVFGTHSLQKQANEFKEQPKVAPIQNIKDYEELINMARRIQESQQAAKQVETTLHGGAQK